MKLGVCNAESNDKMVDFHANNRHAKLVYE